MTKKSPPMTNIYGIKTKTMLLLYKYRIKPVIKQRLFSNLALIGVKNKRRKQMIKTIMKRCAVLMLCMVMTVGLFGCNLSVNNGKRIVRIAIAQSETHPEYLGLVAFKEYVEERLGDKYEVQIFPNELLGSIQKTIELTQTGAIDFAVAGTANLETFADVYEVFSMPYLFDSVESYKAVMQDTDYMENVYESTDSSGFRVLTWYNAGTRNFYGKKAINTPADLS